MHKKDKAMVPVVSAAALALGIWFVYSVIMNARDLVEYGIKNAPASYALILCLMFVAYAWYKNGKKFQAVHIVTLTMLTTSIVIWAAGLSASPIQ